MSHLQPSTAIPTISELQPLASTTTNSQLEQTANNSPPTSAEENIVMKIKEQSDPSKWKQIFRKERESQERSIQEVVVLKHLLKK